MFERSTVVITGAAGGLGFCLTEQLLKAGAQVTATDIRLSSLKPLAEKAHTNGWRLQVRRLDVLQPDAVNALAKEICQKEGHLDFWFNNAGIAANSTFHKLSAADFQRVMDVNFHAVVYGTRAALNIMERQGSGTIVNMASVAGHVCPPLMSAYAAAKHAVVGFSRSLQEELRLQDSDVRLALVSPGFVDTSLVKKGQSLGFPNWLSWMLAKPDATAREILLGLRKNQLEIFPTLNGRTLLKAHKVFPKWTRRSAKLLLTQSWKDVLLNRYNAP